MFPYNNQMSIDRINNQIQELERMKANFQNMPQPTQNIINVGNGTQNDFEARYCNENDKVEEILVSKRTAFISPKNGWLKIKETNGEITEYILTKPKTEQEKYIEELERRIREYEQYNTTNNEVIESNTNDTEHDDTRTKTSSRGILKKS